jgi:hypothetical protein
MMKEEILKRAMFSQPLSKSARNSGIMEGFEDEEIDDLENQNFEDMSPMARSPQNPEILMNTLRGDMRSVDARYMELAQMVGEEAAYETPPEVLAMLQPQLGSQQGGIGALPQGANMMPPQGMPGAAPGMPPQGMPPEGGIAPFSQGGAEQAPPTPDGLPPARAAVGGLQTVASRFGQMVGDRAGTAAQALNAYLGRALMSPQPTLQRMTADGMPLTVQAREALMAGPAGTIVQGTGTRLAPYTTMGPLQSPTLTQGITTGLQQVAANNPRLAELVSRFGPGALAGVLGVEGARQYLTGVSPEDQKLEEFRQQNNMPYAPIPTEAEPSGPVGSMAERRATLSALAPRAVEGAPLEPVGKLEMPAVPAEVDTAEFLKKALASEGKKALSKGERIKAGYEEMLPLYKELLGEDKESAKVNALLLLADAGLKLAGSRQRSLGMAVAEAAAGLPKGFAAIAAQTKEQEGRIKAAALSQAINDVGEQDKFAQAQQLEILKGDFRVLVEQIKKMGSGNVVSEDGGMGLRIGKTKDGGFLGTAIDPNDPTVKTAVGSRFTLRDVDNPFVENRGQAPTTVETDKGERVKLGNTLRSLDNSLSALDNAKGLFQQAYSPGTWFQDKVNNLLVPISGGTIRPDLDLEAAKTQLLVLSNTLSKSIAAANDSGRVAVQEQEWARQLSDAINDPAKFFANKELAAKTLNAIEASLRNGRQQVLTQLGYVSNDYVMRTPNTGTQSDPFTIPSDPNQQKIMFTFLGSTIGKLQDPRAQVYIRMPNGTVSPFSPTQLRGLIGTQ